MNLYVFLFCVIMTIFFIVEEKYQVFKLNNDNDPRKYDKGTIVIYKYFFLIFSIVIFIKFFTIYDTHEETLDKYINYVEQYKELKNPLEAKHKKYIEKNPFILNKSDYWNKKIEEYKKKNENNFQSFITIPDKKLEEALKLKEEISEK